VSGHPWVKEANEAAGLPSFGNSNYPRSAAIDACGEVFLLMRRMLPVLTLFLAAAVAAGCVDVTSQNPAAADAEQPNPVSRDQYRLGTDPRGPTVDCQISDSSDWAAWVRAADQQEPLKLVVAGKVTVPSGGHRLALRLGSLQQQIQHVDLHVEPPATAGTPEAPTLLVREEFPTLGIYKEVQVHCGNRTLAVIRDIIRR
jgi:hypothetical protein